MDHEVRSRIMLTEGSLVGWFLWDPKSHGNYGYHGNSDPGRIFKGVPELVADVPGSVSRLDTLTVAIGLGLGSPPVS